MKAHLRISVKDYSTLRSRRPAPFAARLQAGTLLTPERSREMKLDITDRRHLDAAEGWLEL
jgi:hypothetical protein